MALPSSDLSAPRYQPGDVIAGKYRLDGLLGEGGMGAVWAAFNLQLEAPVAIKLLLRSDHDRAVLTQRLRQEAKATAKLGHPAIVRVFDVGESEVGDPFIVMELLTGRSLATLLAEEGRLSAVRAVQLLLPIADALSVAHAKGIIHRDLKPDNVFIVAEDEQLQPKLVDFGIVKLSDATSEPTHLTQMGTVLGSPEYMSPEQARGLDDVDHRTDIWSFCVVLYEVTSGVTPFAAANYNALLRSIVEEEPRPFVANSQEERELVSILQRGLAKDREQRFRSMSELGRALASWLIRRGVVEDVCGGSLEAKWIMRSSDATALRMARGTLASLVSQLPESGVRQAPELATAPTVSAKTDPVLDAQSRSSTWPQGSSPPRSRLLLALLGAAFGAAVVGLALRSGLVGAEQRPSLSVSPAQRAMAEVPVASVSASEASSQAAPPASVMPAPSAVEQPAPRAPRASRSPTGEARKIPRTSPGRSVASSAPSDLLPAY
jgi:serine/threonine-protein kinase